MLRTRRPRAISLLVPAAALLVGAHLAYAAVYLWHNAPDPDELPFHAGFETGDLSEWDALGARQLCCDGSAVVVGTPVRSGSRAVALSLSPDDPLVRGSRRAEFRLKSARYGKTYAYAFSVFIPKDWHSDPAPVTLAQWHGVKDAFLGEGGLSPPLRLVAEGDRISVIVRWDDRRVSRSVLGSADSAQESVLWSGPLETEHWTDWSFTVRWSWGPNGLVRVRRDGVLVAERVGPNAYNDVLAPYFKVGIYVPAWAGAGAPEGTRPRRALFDEIAAGEVADADVAGPTAVRPAAQAAQAAQAAAARDMVP